MDLSQRSLVFVGQNGGVATPPAESWQLFERCVLHFDMVFDRRIRGVGAELVRSRHGVVAEKLIFCGAERRGRDSACGVIAESWQSVKLAHPPHTSDFCHEAVEFQKMDFFKVPD